ncbi:MAG: pyruvate ferredoxin oxidoreductase subunit gamma [Dehalococcoidales bacterium]|nr:pyruvate ferredoxin oxidoreductase subunit gamma [Dehalococcoidales bacterium]
MDTNRLIEIRWHGRGGQGAVTSAELVAQAAISEGKYAQAFPSFGPERRGAPVLAFVRISSQEPIRIRAEIAQPDVVAVLDPGLLRIVNVASGLKTNGTIIVNTRKQAGQIRQEFGINWRLATIDATSIAREILGVPITNTTMVGALVRATGVVELESLLEPLRNRFGRLAERNIKAMQKAYEETLVEERGQ